MGGACEMYGEKKMPEGFCWVKMKKRDNMKTYA
jgi:hypothetical protein